MEKQFEAKMDGASSLGHAACETQRPQVSRFSLVTHSHPRPWWEGWWGTQPVGPGCLCANASSALPAESPWWTAQALWASPSPPYSAVMTLPSRALVRTVGIPQCCLTHVSLWLTLPPIMGFSFPPNLPFSSATLLLDFPIFLCILGKSKKWTPILSFR